MGYKFRTGSYSRHTEDIQLHAYIGVSLSSSALWDEIDGSVLGISTQNEASGHLSVLQSTTQFHLNDFWLCIDLIVPKAS